MYLKKKFFFDVKMGYNHRIQRQDVTQITPHLTKASSRSHLLITRLCLLFLPYISQGIKQKIHLLKKYIVVGKKQAN